MARSGDLLENTVGVRIYVDGIEGLLEPGESRPRGSLWNVVQVNGRGKGTRFGIPACDLDSWKRVGNAGDSEIEFAKALFDALVLAAEGWGYASDYFIEKWEFVARYNRLAEIAGMPSIPSADPRDKED